MGRESLTWTGLATETELTYVIHRMMLGARQLESTVIVEGVKFKVVASRLDKGDRPYHLRLTFKEVVK